MEGGYYTVFERLIERVAKMGGDVAIAAAGSAVDGRGFVGVWAKDAAGSGSKVPPPEPTAARAGLTRPAARVDGADRG